MFWYVYGEDTFAARQYIETVASQKYLHLRWLDREDLAQQSLGGLLEQSSSGLFGGHLLVVRDVSALPQATRQNIVEAVKQPTKADCVLWDRQEPDKRSALFRAFQKTKRTRHFPSPSIAELVRWLMEEAETRQAILEKAAAEALVARVGVNRWRLRSELEKLILTTKQITSQHVEGSVAVMDSQVGVFDMLDAITAGRPKRVLRALEQLLRAGESELYILSMLGYQFRALFAIASGLQRGLTNQQIAHDYHLHPYVVQKNRAAARRASPAYFLDGLTRVMATDFAIKQGRVHPRTGLVMLVLGFIRQKTPVQ